MSLSGLLRAAWVAVPAAFVCGGALAQQIVTVPPGMVVVLTPGAPPLGLTAATGNAPVLVETARAAVPPLAIERMIAEQQAMMRRMVADMNAMFAPIANPMETIGDMFGRFPGPGTVPPNSGSYCEESVSISYNGGNSAPLVKVSRTGGGCGPVHGAAPVPAVTAPPVADHPKVIEINDPAPVTQPRVRHRT